MAHKFGALVFTPLVKALQERYGSRRQYERLTAAASPDRLRAQERAFIADQDHFYIASVGTTGWPYVQHRGGATGFLKVIDDETIAFADYRGNRQYVTAGNVAADDRVALILVDYPRQARLKILGHASVLEGEAAAPLLPQLRDADQDVVVERAFVIRVAAFDWNCQQHITPRFTEAQIAAALEPFERRLSELEHEHARRRE